MNEMVWKQEYQVEKIAFAMTAIILNILSIPVTILMNVLVIVAVKTRPRLQSKYNILLACLAGTDLLVGAASQPTFIAGQIYVIKGLSLIEYCRYNITKPTRSPFHLIFVIAELWRPEQAEPHNHHAKEIMASGIARGRVRTTTTNDDGGVAQLGGHTLIQPWFTVYFFDIGHPCYDQLTPVKTRYPLTMIT